MIRISVLYRWWCNTRTVMNSSYMQLYRCVYGNGNGREWECWKPFPHICNVNVALRELFVSCVAYVACVALGGNSASLAITCPRWITQRRCRRTLYAGCWFCGCVTSPSLPWDDWNRGSGQLGTVEIAGVENPGVDNAGVDNPGVENAGVENAVPSINGENTGVSVKSKVSFGLLYVSILVIFAAAAAAAPVFRRAQGLPTIMQGYTYRKAARFCQINVPCFHSRIVHSRVFSAPAPHFLHVCSVTFYLRGSWWGYFSAVFGAVSAPVSSRL